MFNFLKKIITGAVSLIKKTIITPFVDLYVGIRDGYAKPAIADFVLTTVPGALVGFGLAALSLVAFTAASVAVEATGSLLAFAGLIVSYVGLVFSIAIAIQALYNYVRMLFNSKIIGYQASARMVNKYAY